MVLLECVNHCILVFTTPMSPAPILFNDALNAPTRLSMGSWINHGEPATIACKFNACKQAKRFGVVHGLKFGMSLV
jgi:hypothetical protein